MEEDTKDDDEPTVAVRGTRNKTGGASVEIDFESTAPPTADTRIEPAARGRLVDDAPTVVERGKSASETPSATPTSVSRSGVSVRLQSSVTSTITTVEDALRLEEIDRVRTFIRLGWALSIMTMAAVPVVDGHLLIGRLLIGGVTLGMIVSFFFERYICTPDRFTETKLAWYLGVLVVANSNVVILFFGTFSAAPAIVIVGIYFIARLESRSDAVMIVGTAAIGHIVCAAIIIFEVIPDPAVWAPNRPLTIPEMMIAEGVVQFLYLATFISGRAARRSSVASIEALKRATGLASQREAMLAELRQDLNMALKVGGPGRYSERELGDYKLGMLIGRGGMGEVYDASHVDTGKPAAVKLLHRELLAAPKHIERFLREVEASRGFESPHVVKVLAASEPADPVPFLVMEKLTGHTLSSILRRTQTLDYVDVVLLAQQVADALDEARSRGIVHRDIKPQNLFEANIDGELMWKVLDFGVASLTQYSGTLTQGAVVGTPAYMSPEQAQGLNVDASADVYALGAVLFRCITGAPPFTAEDMPSLLYKVVHEPVPMLSSLVDSPLALDVVFDKALAKRPEKRFQSAGQLALAIGQCVTR